MHNDSALLTLDDHSHFTINNKTIDQTDLCYLYINYVSLKLNVLI